MNITKEHTIQLNNRIEQRLGWLAEGSDVDVAAFSADVRECLSIMRGLAEDAEPVAPIPYSGADENPPVFARRWKLARDGYGLQRDDAGNYVHIDDALSVIHAATSPQAAQTDEREAFEAWPRACREIIDRWVAPDMYKYAVAMLDLAIQADQAGRAGRKG